MTGNFTIRKAEKRDAAQLLKFMKTVGSETDMLLTDENGSAFSLDEEEDFIERANTSDKRLFLVALMDGQIVASCGFSANESKRLQHWGRFGISVLKAYWRQGIATGLMEVVIGFAKEIGLDSISLEVRSDNEAAIKLYEKFGFKKCGSYERYFLIRGTYFDAYFMRLQLPN